MAITVRLIGGLGNQLFQYAAGLFVAKSLGKKLHLDTSGLFHLQERGKGTARDFSLAEYDLSSPASRLRSNLTSNGVATLEGSSPWGTFLASSLATVHRAAVPKTLYAADSKGWTLEELIALKGVDSIYMSGYWTSSIQHLVGLRRQLSVEVRPKREMPRRMNLLVEKISGCQSTAIHVRRTDFLSSEASRRRNEICLSFYLNAMDHVRERTETFYIFSDDIEWCQDKFGDRNVTYVSRLDGESDAQHLYTMSKAQNFIVPNSTFSWWAAWLSASRDKVVIRPHETVSTGVQSFANLYPLNWEALGC